MKRGRREMNIDEIDFDMDGGNSGNNNNVNVGFEETIDAENVPLNIEEVIEVDVGECFGCKYLNERGFQSNTKLKKLMELYTENVCSMSKDAIFKQIKEYYDHEIYPEMEEVGVGMEWDLDQIRAHFNTHTNYPTDKILSMIRMYEGIVNRLANETCARGPDGRMVFNEKNLKLLLTMNDKIMILRKMKDHLPNMIGYSTELSF